MEPVTFWNHDMKLGQDAKILCGWVIAFAITIPLFQKLFLWPAAKFLLRRTTDTKVKSIPYTKEDQGKHVVRNRTLKSTKNNGSVASASATSTTSHQREYMVQWKFVVAATKMFSYLFFLTFSAWAMQNEMHWFWEPSVWHMGGNITISPRLKLLYFMETAYYIYTLFAMFWEPKMKDRGQMIFHHVFTITLLTSSYFWNQYRYGTLIMMLHDFSDPWMEAAKLFNYVNIAWGANICFTVFALSFFYLRDYIFPRYLIGATYFYARPAGSPHYWVTFLSLGGLWVLHIVWSTMICRVFYENVIVNSGLGDVREEKD